MFKFRTIGECASTKIEGKTVIKVPAEKEMLDTLKRIAFDNDTSVAEIIRVVMADFLTSYRNDSGSEIGVSNA